LGSAKVLDGQSTNFAKLKRKAAFNSYSLGGLTCAGKGDGKL
jgi:hypothetical protein